MRTYNQLALMGQFDAIRNALQTPIVAQLFPFHGGKLLAENIFCKAQTGVAGVLFLIALRPPETSGMKSGVSPRRDSLQVIDQEPVEELAKFGDLRFAGLETRQDGPIHICQRL